MDNYLESYSQILQSMNRAQLLDVLQHNPTAWNELHQAAEQLGQKLDLTGANLLLASLRGVNLSKVRLGNSYLEMAELSEADLSGSNLRNANLRGTYLVGTDLTNADLRKANLSRANLRGANLQGANLCGAIVDKADLQEADLSGANLREATLNGSILVRTNLSGANMSGCSVHGISAWNVNLKDTIQTNLVITDWNESPVTVDNLAMAQFVYVLLNNQNIRSFIDTVTSKLVLILGRFTAERKAVLDAIREELRRRDFMPVLFDFDRPLSKDITGTVETLARLARFIIADLTDPSSIPHELATIVPYLRTTPVLPIKLKGSSGYTMFDDFRRAYSWVLDHHEYRNIESLISDLPKIIAPADKMAEQLRDRL